MAVQLQPAEIELRIVTDEAERQLATFREKVKTEGEAGEFQAGEGGGQAPQKVVDKLKAEAEAKAAEAAKSWGQKDAFFQKFAKGTPPRVHTEIASWAKDRVWEGIDYVHGRRVVESAGNMISGLTKTLESGRLTAITDRAMITMSPWLKDKGGIDERNARRIVGAARVGVEVARWAAKYGSGERTDTHAALNTALKPLGDYKDPETGEMKHDASMVSKMASDVIGGFDFSREGIINSEAGMKASLQTLSQMTNMGMALVKGGLGEQIVGLDIGDWMGEYATRTYDWNKLQEKMRTEAETAGTRAFIGHVGGVILDKIGLGGTQLE